MVVENWYAEARFTWRIAAISLLDGYMAVTDRELTQGISRHSEPRMSPRSEYCCARVTRRWIIQEKRGNHIMGADRLLWQPSLRIDRVSDFFFLPYVKTCASVTRVPRVVQDSIVFRTTTREKVQRRLAHIGSSGIPPLGVRTFNSLVDEGIIEARGGRIASPVCTDGRIKNRTLCNPDGQKGGQSKRPRPVWG